MGLELHTVSVVSGSNPPAQSDRLLVAMFPDVAIQAGDGGIASIAVTTAGNYPGPTIPTVAINTPTTGSGGAATAVMKAVTAAVAAGGSGYAVNDTVTLTGGTGTKSVLTVLTVDGSGAILTCSITTVGAYTVLPSSPVAQGSTSGSGTSATFTMHWGVASITVGTAGTLYPDDGSVTASVSGGTPTTAAVLANPVVSTIAGEPAVLAFTGLNLPANYAVLCNPQQDATWYASSKTSSGFKVTLNPRLAGSSLAAGNIDVMVFA